MRIRFFRDPTFLLTLLVVVTTGCMEGGGLARNEAASLDPVWVERRIADALTAAPATVTREARVYAWTDSGEMVLVRDGSGPYTCVASWSYSLRVGKPALPHPDPLCADQNAWAFIRAFWAQDDPMNPSESLPDAPGLVWMLGGMNIAGGQVAYGSSDDSLVETAPQTQSDEILNMTPHVMILPLAIDPDLAELPDTYAADHTATQWVMAARTPAAHLHVHFSHPLHRALMAVGRQTP